jgi:hypothetical protein
VSGTDILEDRFMSRRRGLKEVRKNRQEEWVEREENFEIKIENRRKD